MTQFFQSILGSNLQNRVTLFFIIIAATPVLILGGVSLYMVDLSHQRDVSNLEQQFIDEKIDEIQKFFNDTLGIIELRVGFTQKSEIELSQQIFLLDGLLEENRAFEEVSFTDLFGKETAKKIRGQIFSELIDVSRLSKFSIAVNGDNFIGDIYHTLSGPLITLSAPVRNRNGDIIQVLSAEVNLTQLIRSLDASRLGTAGFLVLADSSGALINTRAAFDVKPGTDLSGLERIDRVVKGETMDGLGERDRYFSFFVDAPVVGAGKKVPEIGWLIMAEWPLQDADAIVRDISEQVLQMIVFTILAVLVIAPFFANRLIKPIHALKHGAEAVEKGNFNNLVEIKTNDELEELGGAFNQMTAGLKRLQELKDEFVFVAAHELRSPVTVIKGYISMVLDGEAGTIPVKAKEFIGEVDKANQRLLQLVGDLLEMARSEAGRLTIDVKPVDIRSSINDSVKELKPLADEKNISISYELPLSPILVLADNNRIKEVVINLAGNAIKYSPEKSSIRVSHEIKSDEVITHVKDNGFGIPKEAQSKLFEKFYRVQTDKTKDITGTGLGLFIIKQIIEKMNGKIWFVSEEGKGSTFSFSLPVAKV